MPKITNLVHATTRIEWRKWLEKNHNKEKDAWLVYFKVHTGKQSVAYNDAVEEALCFGWIDSTVKKIDGERFAQRFTPRKLKGNWAETNIKRVKM
ncbi:MAG: hypothetical protein AABX51_02700, partial [Nanoarchaeota archaeon]